MVKMSDPTQVDRIAQLFTEYWVRDHGQASLDGLQRQSVQSAEELDEVYAVMSEAFTDLLGVAPDLRDGHHQKIWTQAWAVFRGASKDVAVVAEQSATPQAPQESRETVASRLTLEELAQAPFIHDAYKHDLGGLQTPGEYASEEIDRMSNSEFLAMLSFALEEWRTQFATPESSKSPSAENSLDR
jgi:hypothetical protein